MALAVAVLAHETLLRVRRDDRLAALEARIDRLSEAAEIGTGGKDVGAVVAEVTLARSGYHLVHAVALFAIACLCGVSVVVWPEAAGFGGLAFLIAITLCGAALMFVLTSGRLVSPR